MSSIFCIAMVGFTACQQKEQPKLTPENYRSWNTMVENFLDYPIPGHESNSRMIYINKIGEDVQITEENGRVSYQYPEGTIIVKEIYSKLEPPQEKEQPINLTIMIKDSRHSHAHALSGWVWLVTTPETGEEHILDYNVCADCHTNANEPHPYGDKNPNADFRDFVFFPPHPDLSNHETHEKKF